MSDRRSACLSGLIVWPIDRLEGVLMWLAKHEKNQRFPQVYRSSAYARNVTPKRLGSTPPRR